MKCRRVDFGQSHRASQRRNRDDEHAWSDLQQRLAAFIGPSDFSLFQIIDHGNLLSAHAGRAIRAATYVFGNALIAIEMTRHVAAAGLYVPLRLFIEELAPVRVLVTDDVIASAVTRSTGA